MNVEVVAEEESLLVTVPVIELLELSASVNVLLVIVEVSINSLKVAEMLETTVVAPSDGEVEETVGAVVSTTKVFTSNVLLALLAESVTVMVQLL